MSTKIRTTVDATIVVYELPGIARCASSSRTTSPPRAGRIALTPTPETYAARIGGHRTVRSGYAAARTFRQARLVQASLSR